MSDKQDRYTSTQVEKQLRNQLRKQIRQGKWPGGLRQGTLAMARLRELMIRERARRVKLEVGA